MRVGKVCQATYMRSRKDALMIKTTERCEGAEYWHQMRLFEQNCENETIRQSFSENEIFKKLGTIVSLLYRVAECHWGCHGREHIFEYFSGRVCTTAHSSLRLLTFGYYDESLALTRNISEIGNLTFLFLSEPNHIRNWLDATDRDRKRNYSPVGVRRLLEDAETVIPTNQERYSWLCEAGTHITPKTLPQAHNSDNRPILGAMHQPKGVEVALDALAWSVCTVSGPLAKLADLDEAPAERLLNETISLAMLLFEKPDGPLSEESHP